MNTTNSSDIIEITGQLDMGFRGDDGLTPYIGENGNWWIGGVDTNFPSRGPKGEPGYDYDAPHTGNPFGREDGKWVNVARKEDADYLYNVTRRGTMEVWHAIIDYTKRFDVRATGSTVVARFAVNPYNPKPQNQFIIPSYDVTDGVKVRMKICSDAACTNVIAEEGEMVEFAAGTFVYVKYDLYYNSSVLGKKVKFAAKDIYGDYVGEMIETLSPVTLFCESDFVSPMHGDIKVHCLGGMLTAAGKMFGSDYRYLSKLTIDGVPPSGGGDISRASVGKNFVLHVNASASNDGDIINIRVENAALDVKVSNETSPAYNDVAYDIEELKAKNAALEARVAALEQIINS